MAETTLTARNPRDSVATYQRIRFERGLTSGGAFAEIANVLINQYDETTEYTDLGGTTTDWYKYRYANTAGTSFSDYNSSPIQAGDYKVRQRIKRSIPDADITDVMWDDWRDNAILELNAQAIGRYAEVQTIAPTSGGVYNFSLNGDIRRVLSVELFTTGGTRIRPIAQWMQRGRSLWLTSPSSSYKYHVYGIAEIRDSADLDDELWLAVEKYMRWMYYETRTAQRANYPLFLSSDKKTDVGGEEISEMAINAKQDWLRYIDLLRSGLSL